MEDMTHFLDNDRVLDEPCYRAGRAALVREFRIRGDGISPKPHKTMHRFIHLWRERVAELGAAGWTAAQGERAQALRNCPPFGVPLPGFRPWTCRQAYACPFCWGRRRVIVPYMATVKALREGARWVVTFRRTVSIAIPAEAGPARLRAAAIAAESALTYIAGDRGRESRGFWPHAGACVAYSAFLSETAFTLVKAGVVLPCGRPTLPAPGTDEARERGVDNVGGRLLDRPDALALAKAFARAHTYPADLLRPGRWPEDTAMLFNKLRGPRLTTSYGAYRTGSRSLYIPGNEVSPDDDKEETDGR